MNNLNTNEEHLLQTVIGMEEEQELFGPKKCKECKTGDVCNILTTILAFYRLGLVIQVDNCPYFKKEHKC